MKQIALKGKSGVCNIVLETPITRLKEYYGGRITAIITDKTVHFLHGHLFPHHEIIVIETGEQSKTLDTVEHIYEKFLQWELDRSSFVVGIGGGNICDITGFAATTYLRGISFGLVPTTLLSQVDASIGGKNGVNYKGYKNLIGTFNQPRFVLCDFEFLKTLPAPELKNGFAEVIKHAAIGNTSLFSYLEKYHRKALSLEGSVIKKIVYESLMVKRGVVLSDETERGERRKLNFGHTLGHAIETTVGLKHGEAVSIGMVAAARLSQSKGMLLKEDVERIETLLKNFGLPVNMKGDRGLILDAIRKDKKREGEEINFVLLDRIGNARIVAISIEELEGAI
jgi:3-dehydroquinate synthase